LLRDILSLPEGISGSQNYNINLLYII